MHKNVWKLTVNRINFFIKTNEKYNNSVEDFKPVNQRSLYDSLPVAFTVNDVYKECLKLGVKTPVKIIIFNWKKLGYVKKLSKNEFEKTSPSKKNGK